MDVLEAAPLDAFAPRGRRRAPVGVTSSVAPTDPAGGVRADDGASLTDAPTLTYVSGFAMGAEGGTTESREHAAVVDDVVVRNADRTMGAVVVTFGFALVLGIAAVLAIAGLQSKKSGDRLFAFGAAGFLALSGSVLLLGVFALRRSANRPTSVLDTLRELQARYGGEVHTASLFSPLVQPRLVAFVSGREVELRCFRRRRGLVGLALGLPGWFYFVTARCSPRAEVFLVAPAFARETRLGLFGRVPVPAPRPLQGGIEAFSRDASAATGLLADPELLGRLEHLSARRGVQSAGVTPSPLGGLGAIVSGGLTTDLRAAGFATLVDEVVAVARRIG